MGKGSARPSLRERQRLKEMRRVQRLAVDWFGSRGFDDVSVEELAGAAEVSPVSIYRWFGTKERLVLWDEYDPGILAAVTEQLQVHPPLAAVREAIVAELDRLYDADRELVLARTQLIHREPRLLSAAREDARLLELAFREVFAAAGAVDGEFPRAVLATTAVAVLVTAVEAWQAADGRVPLAGFVREGFGALGVER
ncbi:MAG: TetR family transcriptional regulator [Thermoleophilaceae bacterium]|nr:TetR family transcriptional regulator [Thermoleophilaceae bacterium]